MKRVKEKINKIEEISEMIDEFIGKSEEEALARCLKEEKGELEINEFLMDLRRKIEDTLEEDTNGVKECDCEDPQIFERVGPGGPNGPKVYSYCLKCGGNVDHILYH